MASSKSRWTGYSLRTQFIIAGLAVSLGFLILVEALSLGFLGAIIGNIGSTTNDALSTQLTQALTANVNDAASLFENDLNKIARSISLLISQAAGVTFRSDQPFATVPSYFDSPAGIQAAESVVPPAGSRFSGWTISLKHSTYLVPNVIGSEPPGLTPAQQAIVDATAHMDPIFRSSYQLNPNVAILYVGFDEGGVYRRYPGTGDSRNQTAYDPRVRPWYKDAQANPTSAYVVTDPYRDAFGQGWEITVSSLIRNTSSGAIIGVAGVDVVIDTLKATLESQAAKGGSMSLYQTNGVALSNPSWNLKTWTADVPFTYRNATNPTINADLWDRMRSASSGVASSEVYKDPSSGDNYLVVYKVLNITNGKLSPSYVSVSAFPMALVNIPVQNVQARMNNILATYSGISVGIFLAVLIIVSTSVAILANSAAQPLVRLSHESEKISRNIGENDLFAGVDPTNGGGKGIALARIDETEELSQRFYSMIETLRATTKAPAGKANPFYKNSEMPDWNSNVHSKNVVDKVPDLPPPSYEAAESPESGTPGSAA